MYWTMLRRELLGRKRQTIIVAAGLAVAIALVIVVSALSNGVRQAQSQALESVYGVGTDLTVAGAPQEPGQGRGQRFDFGDGEGNSSDGTTKIDQSRLTTGPGRSTIEASTVGTIGALAGVQQATGVLSLNNVTFSGQMPDRSQMSQNGGDGSGMPMPPSGGSDGAGGSSFGIDSFSVLGVDPGVSDAGPLSS
ncbi:MAG: ABC transporter permease, partial [Actinobacteria bacterium]|nr:ABC transporter permease [Actinomycetota bacterium]